MTAEHEAKAIRKAVFEIIERFDANNVAIIEKELTKDDKISLFYLLNDDPKETLDCLMNGSDKQFVTEWCRKSGNYGEWKLRMIESLLVMQNYRTLKMLKYNKMALKEVKLILNRVDRSRDFDVRKALYSTFDHLTVDELRLFVSAVNNVKQSDDTRISPRYIEMYLLLWQIQGYFSFKDVNSLNFLLNVLSELHFTSSYNILKQFMNDPYPSEININEDVQSLLSVDSFQNTLVSQSGKSYPLFDEKNVGICIIVNQKEYWPSSKCNRRRGSEIDCKRIEDTMNAMNIKPILLQNLIAIDIFPSIETVARYNFIRGVHSVLIVVIMAHGDRDFIKGIDGESVRSDLIKEVLSHNSLPSLIDVPKVIVFQSCRGENHEERKQFESDGCDLDSNIPRLKTSMKHYILCFPCTPDFKAYRNPTEGSPYIQILCKTLLKMYNTSDVLTILIQVNGEFASNTELQFKVKDHIVVMQPEFTCSLTGPLYFAKQS